MSLAIYRHYPYHFAHPQLTSFIDLFVALIIVSNFALCIIPYLLIIYYPKTNIFQMASFIVQLQHQV